MEEYSPSIIQIPVTREGHERCFFCFKNFTNKNFLTKYRINDVGRDYFTLYFCSEDEYSMWLFKNSEYLSFYKWNIKDKIDYD